VKNKLLFILVFCFSTFAFTQNTIFGKVVDAKTKLPLKNVAVQIDASLKGTTSDTSGFFKLSVKENEILLKFSSLGYEIKYLAVNAKKEALLLVELTEKLNVLEEVVIGSSSVEVIAKDKRNDVLDYNFYDDNILLIMQRTGGAQSKLALINPALDTLCIIKLPDEPLRLFKDCFGHHHVVCERGVYQVYSKDSLLYFLPPVSIQDFETLLAPCVAEDSVNLYFENRSGAHPVDAGFRIFNSHNHTVVYSSVSKKNKTQSTLALIRDDKTIKLREDEEYHTKLKNDAGLKPDPLFAEVILFKEIYAPLFRINDRILIFDYVNGKIKSHNLGGEITAIATIDFHEEKSWQREMCVDEKQNKAYALFEKNGVTELKEINTVSGKLGKPTKIPFVFVGNIKVRDGYVYFLYKGKEYSDTRYLSRLKLN
jgi:hypothetical protein